MTTSPKKQVVDCELIRFNIEVGDPSLASRDIDRILITATREAVTAANDEGLKISVESELEGGFGGVGEVAAIIRVMLPAGEATAKAFALGAVGQAGGLFFKNYLAPRLRKLNLLPSKARAIPEHQSWKRSRGPRRRKGTV